MKKIKVASFFRSMEVWVSWGAGKVHATLGRLLDQEKYDMTYIQMQDGEPRYEHTWAVINLDEPFYLWFGLKKILSLRRMAYKIKKISRENWFEVIVWQGDFFFMVTGLSKLLWNKSVTVGLVHTTLSIWPRYIRFVLLCFLRLNDYIVTISEQEKTDLTKSLGKKWNDIKLIHNSIDIAAILSKSTSQIDVEDEKILWNNIFTFIAVWRLTYQKNFWLLIKAFKEAYGDDVNTQLVILWDGEEDGVLNEQSQWSNIFFLWQKNNPFAYMNRADCFVLSSRFEWYPMVMLEACVCGLPIVSVNCPTWPSEVIGQNAWWILVSYDKDDDEKTIYSLAEWLTQIRRNDLKHFSLRNKNFVKQYDNKKVATVWSSFFAQILGK